jgi:folate-dependent phosphoribosylglycinamide formyltransferase PurN
LICHEHDPLNSEFLPRWLAGFSDVVAVVLIREGRAPQIRRLRAEYRRVGPWRLFDVFAFRVYYGLFLAAADRAWKRAQLDLLTVGMPAPSRAFATLTTPDPNDDGVVDFLRRARPDLTIARCKWLLKPSVYEVPRLGTFVLHPGICPQYRNAHGCFWALASNDLENVGLTLLRVDEGIDTGPIYEFFRYRFDARAESHVRIQERVVLENLDAIRAKLLEIAAGRARPLAVAAGRSRNWGQPWLSAYFRWRRAARRALQ